MFEWIVRIVIALFICAVNRSRPVDSIQCEKITVPACQGLGYNMTAMPNLAGHTNQKDAEAMINQLLPILDSECSQHARFLLCASMFPLCSPDVSKPVAACRSLCETVKTECSTNSILELLWPKFIDCSTMPQPDKQELCMQVPKDELQFRPTEKNHFWPWQNIPIGRKIGGTLGLKPMNPIICPTNFTAVHSECGAQCGADAMFTGKQKDIVELWTLGLSAICFVLTLFSLVTFWAEPMRFGYPERPVLYLALCYNLLSIFYLERIIFHESIKGKEVNEDNANGSCEISAPCLASFVTINYLTLCGATWWLIFSVGWYLSTEKQWSSEALERKAGIFHILAWVPPLAPPIAALLWGGINTHELTGMCTAVGYTEIPAMLLLLSGAVFTILATRSLKRLSITVNDYLFNKKLMQVRSRILIFSCVFFVPAFSAIIIGVFVETNGRIRSCQLGDPCTFNRKLSAIPTLVRLLFVLAGGSLTGMWGWTKKTCESYRSRMSSNGTIAAARAHQSGALIKVNENSMTKKSTKLTGPLYAGINFHSVPGGTISVVTI